MEVRSKRSRVIDPGMLGNGLASPGARRRSAAIGSCDEVTHRLAIVSQSNSWELDFKRMAYAICRYR